MLGTLKPCSLGLQRISLILEMHVMVNSHLSKQGICRPVSRDHIRGSGFEFMEILCFFLKLTVDDILVFRLDRGLTSS